MLLETTAFFTRLRDLSTAARQKNGAVTITLKKYDGRTRPHPRDGRDPLPDAEQHYCLLRAQFRASKISTIVEQGNVAKAMELFGKTMKSSMDGLKKVKSKAKSKKNKRKATG